MIKKLIKLTNAVFLITIAVLSVNSKLYSEAFKYNDISGLKALEEFILTANTSNIDNAIYYGLTPVMLCAIHNKVEMFEILKDKNPNINLVTNESGYSALHFAAIFGNIAMVKALLNSYADVTVQTQYRVIKTLTGPIITGTIIETINESALDIAKKEYARTKKKEHNVIIDLLTKESSRREDAKKHKLGITNKLLTQTPLPLSIINVIDAYLPEQLVHYDEVISNKNSTSCIIS